MNTTRFLLPEIEGELTLLGLKAGDSFLLRPGMLVGQSY